MKVKEDACLKLSIQKTKMLASAPNTSWQIGGETIETGGKKKRDFIFLGSKITVDGDCSHEIKRHLLFGRKAMTNLGSMLKSRHYFADKGLYKSKLWFFQSSYMNMRIGP